MGVSKSFIAISIDRYVARADKLPHTTESHVIFGNVRQIEKVASYPESWYFNLFANLLSWGGIVVNTAVNDLWKMNRQSWIIDRESRGVSPQRLSFPGIMERFNVIIYNNYVYVRQRLTFFSKFVGQGRNIAVTIMLTRVRLSRKGVGHTWDRKKCWDSGTEGISLAFTTFTLSHGVWDTWDSVPTCLVHQ